MPDEDQKLKLSRDYAAPVEKVWAAWSDPEIFAQWYGFPGHLQDVTIDFKEGGKWQATTVTPDGQEFPQIGAYTLIDNNHHIRFRFLNPTDPDDLEYETMDVVFDGDDVKTRMSFIQAGNLSPETYADGLKAGWTGFFDKLGEILAG